MRVLEFLKILYEIDEKRKQANSENCGPPLWGSFWLCRKYLWHIVIVLSVYHIREGFLWFRSYDHKVNILEMQVKGHGEGHKVKNMGTDGKGLSQGIHM